MVKIKTGKFLIQRFSNVVLSLVTRVKTPLILEASNKILFGVVGAAIFYGVTLCIKPKPMVASVNINKLMAVWTLHRAKDNTNTEASLEAAKQFALNLEKEVHRLAKEKGTPLLISEAVVAGGVDYTPELEKRLFKKGN